jgi:hypothetical protein
LFFFFAVLDDDPLLTTFTTATRSPLNELLNSAAGFPEKAPDPAALGPLNKLCCGYFSPPLDLTSVVVLERARTTSQLPHTADEEDDIGSTTTLVAAHIATITIR